MRYTVTYQIKTDRNTLSSSFEMESEDTPSATDTSILEYATKDSAKFRHSGLIAITVTLVEPCRNDA